MKEPMTPTRLFIAYSRKDSELLDELKIFLQPLVQKYNLTIWNDKEIDAGAAWELEIKKNLDSANIFLFLISADSLASDYFHNKELSFAIERHKKGEVKIIPIIMRSCGWKHSKIADLQVLPTDGKPVYSSHWSYKNEAYTNILDGIEKVLLQKKRDKEKQLQEAKQKEIAAANETERLRIEKEQQKIKDEVAENKKAEEAIKREEELVDWEKTKADNKITIYQKFIKKYPESEFNKTANDEIELLRSKNKTKKKKPKKTSSISSTSNISSSNPSNTPKTEDTDWTTEKAGAILLHSFYASLPVIGLALINMIGNELQVPLIQDILSFQLVYGGAIIGIIAILIYQLIIVADEYSYMVKEETEVQETVWGVVLTIISFGAMSALGIFLCQIILANI